ncbi:OmpA family protein [Pedobacter steynii]
MLPASVTELNTLADLLRNNANIRIEIQGHTDNVGNVKDNEKLSMQRAKAVYDYLLENKIAADCLTYKGYGETKPIALNNTEENRKLNRRTSFVISKL